MALAPTSCEQPLELAAAERLDTCAPLRVMFVKTFMPVGGAETLLVNLLKKMDRARFTPELCCLKQPGPLGEQAAELVNVHSGLLKNKFDLRVLRRLKNLLVDRQIDAVVTVGAGDKMFWGRLAARWARVPVVISALHSTGWPDGVGRLNRLLTPITDGFVAVASEHGRFLEEYERFPAEKVHVIPNGVDTDRFAPLPGVPEIRLQLGLRPASPVVSIVAALRPEKNHEMFLGVASRVLKTLPDAQFLIVGEGGCMDGLKCLSRKLGLEDAVHFLGSRSDIPRILSATDVFALTSHNEANPVSILEAMSVGRPVVATDVGSVRESVIDGETGYLVGAGDEASFAKQVVRLLQDPLRCQEFGSAARRQAQDHWSLEAMVRGYEDLITSLWTSKVAGKTHRELLGSL